MIKRKPIGKKLDHNGLPPLVADAPDFFYHFLRFGVIGLVCVGVIVLGWFAMREYKQPSNLAEVPFVEADKSPLKVKPADPGGMEIANQDKEVYDIIAENGGEVPDIALEWAQIPDASETEGLEHVEVQKLEDEPETTRIPTPSREENVMEIVKESLKPEENSVINTTSAAVETPSKTSDFFTHFSVQVGSYQSEKSANAGLESLQKKFAKQFNGLSSLIKSVEIQGKGTFHRLYVGPFSSQDNAESFCRKLVTKGQGCIVAKL